MISVSFQNSIWLGFDFTVGRFWIDFAWILCKTKILSSKGSEICRPHSAFSQPAPSCRVGWIPGWISKESFTLRNHIFAYFWTPPAIKHKDFQVPPSPTCLFTQNNLNLLKLPSYGVCFDYNTFHALSKHSNLKNESNKKIRFIFKITFYRLSAKLNPH